MSRFTVRDLTLAALIAAVYAALTVLLPIPAYGGIQFRAAEALTVLPYLFPAAVPGLTVGCFLANLASPYPLDAIFGTLATFLACLLTRRAPGRFAAVLPPVLCNALLVGLEVTWYETGFGPGFLPAFALNACTIGAGELVSCGVLGSLLLRVLPGIPPLRPYMAPHSPGR